MKLKKTYKILGIIRNAVFSTDRVCKHTSKGRSR